MACFVLVQGVLADTITYQQLRQDQGGRTSTTATAPVATRAGDPPNSSKAPATNATPQEPRAQESPNHPEFVRLPDGRIVRYGPGVICDENCVEPVGPYAFRGPGRAFWWIVPPIVAGGILCAILCRPDDNNPQPTPTITIPPTSPTPTPVTPTPIPTPTATPPPAEIPEPGTLILVGLGLGTMLARRRKRQD